MYQNKINSDIQILSSWTLLYFKCISSIKFVFITIYSIKIKIYHKLMQIIVSAEQINFGRSKIGFSEDPNAMERVAQTPNKVHPPTLNTILYLSYISRLWKWMAGAVIKPQSQRSQKRAEVPEAVSHLYYIHWSWGNVKPLCLKPLLYVS